MDFSSLGTVKKKSAPIEPIELFEALPSLENTPNDLWRGQAEALTGWHQAREKRDVLVSLNTGAGKTIAGVLMAQSLVNEGVEYVVYACSTIDLVNQTARECDRLGIKYTTRVKNSFSNTLFEKDEAFCITTYAALLNGYSAIRRKYFPGAIIFDDAHVAEANLRNAMTLRIDGNDHRELFKEIASLFAPHFKKMGVLPRFKDSLTPEHHATSLVAPRGLYKRKEQLLAILHKHGVRDDSDQKYPFAYLEEHIEACAAIFSRGVFELAPPFLPSLALDIFERPIRRVYLSATLQSQTDFVRAFGREPQVSIVPSNDAGNGERLIVFSEGIKKGFSSKYVEGLSKTKKVVVSVPTYHEAEKKWSSLGTAPSTEDFTDSLNAFREAKSGAFILVSRVDGIDLPHDTCRIMVMDGVPGASSLLERYQWEFLKMNNVHAVRVANRLAQLFGRINRGRNDYGVFLIEGRDLNIWLQKDRNLVLLPPLLQKQILLGRSVQEGLSLDNTESVTQAIASVLGREQTWLDHYEAEVKLGELDQDHVERAKLAEPELIEAAKTEARYAEAIWNRDYTRARRTIEGSLDRTATADTPLGGWHGVWLGAAFDLEGDAASAEAAYMLARKRIGPAITLPRPKYAPESESDLYKPNPFADSLNTLLGHSHGTKFEDELSKLRSSFDLILDGTTNQAEEGVRVLGEFLGFQSTRPDNEQGTGPDVMWRDEDHKEIIGFELKTDKEPGNAYFKKEIAQGHDHISWMRKNHSDHNVLGLLFVGPIGDTDARANPSNEMGICTSEHAKNLADNLTSMVDDFRSLTPLDRAATIKEESLNAKWTLESLFSELWVRELD